MTTALLPVVYLYSFQPIQPNEHFYHYSEWLCLSVSLESKERHFTLKYKKFLVAQQLCMSSCFFVCLCVSHPAHIWTHMSTFRTTNQKTEIYINGFVMAKSALQLLYGPVLGYFVFSRKHTACSFRFCQNRAGSLLGLRIIDCIIQFHFLSPLIRTFSQGQSPILLHILQLIDTWKLQALNTHKSVEFLDALKLYIRPRRPMRCNLTCNCPVSI